MMFNTIFKIVLREKSKNYLALFLSILTLTCGYTIGVLVSEYYKFETSYDNIYEKRKNIYVLKSDENNKGSIQHWSIHKGEIASKMAIAFEEVKDFTTIIIDSQTGFEINEVYSNSDILIHTDPKYFQIFDHQYKYGNSHTALNVPNSVVLTESTANKFFGDENPLDKKIKWSSPYAEVHYLSVSAVIKDFPKNSTMVFDIAMSNDVLLHSNIFGGPVQIDDIHSRIYFFLENVDDINAFNTKVTNYFKKIPDYENFQFTLQPLEDVHLKSQRPFEEDYNNETNYGDLVFLKLFLTLIILLITLINYSNICFTDALIKNGKYKFRWILGERKIYLFVQLILQNGFVNIISIFLSFLILLIFSSYLNNFFENPILSIFIVNSNVLIFYLITFVAFVIIPSLLSFFAIYLLGRGINKSNIQFKSKLTEKASVILQFSTCIVIIIFALTIQRQYNYMLNMEDGIDSENVIVLFSPMDQRFTNNHIQFRDELLEVQGLTSISWDRYLISTKIKNQKYVTSDHLSDEKIWLPFHKIDKDYFKTFNIKMVEGKYFEEHDPKDDIIINESALRKLRLKSPKEAIGKVLVDDRFGIEAQRFKIMGVVADYNHEAMLVECTPQIFYNIQNLRHHDPMFIYLKINPQNPKETIENVKKVWNKYFSYCPFRYEYLDDIINSNYRYQRIFGKIISLISLVLIVVMCLGIYNLSSITMRNKKKEVCIRKVLGASDWNLIKFLTENIFYQLLISLLIAFPIAYLTITNFLNNFYYRIDIPVVVFVYSFVILVGLLILSIGYILYRTINQSLLIGIKEE